MSKETVLTVIDVTGTQSYIFRSNRLRESIGASELVAKATSWWVFDLLRTLFAAKTNLDPARNSTNSISPFAAIQDKAIESGLDAEVIYVGGGNALVLFDNFDKAKLFTRTYTKKLLMDAPGLDVVIAHSSAFDITDFTDQNNIRNKHAEVVKKVTRKKANRPLSSKIEGLAVSTQCVSTGGVALFNPLQVAKGDEEFETLLDKYEGKYVSAEVLAKLKAVKDANRRLENNLFAGIKEKEEVRQKLGAEKAKRLGVPYQFDNLGRTEGEASLIAVVHTDGNGMGKRIKEFGERPDIDSSRKWIAEMREMSRTIDAANLEALRKTTDFLASKLEKDDDGDVVLRDEDQRAFKLKTRSKKRTGKSDEIICYPFRPIVFGGEDVAFICDGRIALDLTAYYLKALEETTLADGRPLYGRAGVAIVKSHYPFRRAYDLAEDLARSAKERINEFKDAGVDKNVSALDWHVAFTGLAGSIGEIRDREYTLEQGKLNMRPVSIGETIPHQEDWRTWENFVSMTREFQTNWGEMRHKAKRLREALREGQSEVEHFLHLNDLTLLEVKELPGMKKAGWDETSGRCGYFDALEMMDLYFSLGKQAVTKCEDEPEESEEEAA